MSPPPAEPGDLVYEGVAEFAAELVRRGVTEVVISPGSRSAPLAVTLHAQPSLRTWIQLDERSAAFFALGLGRARGRPAVLVCTSGTAAANYLPAVIEAHHAGVPLIVCTADRPPELRDWGAGQTIDQVGIYGTATRWATDLPVMGEVSGSHLRMTAMRAVSAATGADPGPVHLNWPFREPLEPNGVVPVIRVDGESRRPARAAAVPGQVPGPDGDLIAALTGHERGVVIMGPQVATGLAEEEKQAAGVRSFAAVVGWPVIGEALTQVRRADEGGDTVVAHADRLLADDGFAAAMIPEVVIRIGRSPTTKPVRLWLERHRPERVVLVDPAEHWHEASFTLTDHVRTPASGALVVAPGASSDRRADWIDAWRAADSAAGRAIDATVADGPLLSAAVTRTLVEALPSDSVLMVSNSMPVRDLDTFGGADVAPMVVGNRGASGIDGVVSTALGLAAGRVDRSAALFTGDLALLHDLSGVLAAGRLGLHLTVVCVDNDGGGIFSMLPIAARGGDVDFETLFRTPHGLDLDGLDGLGAVRARRITSAPELATTVATTMTGPVPGVDLLIVPVDRDADVGQRRSVAAAVSAALAELRR